MTGRENGGFGLVELPIGGGRSPNKHEPDRHCPTCGTRLSTYNPGPSCYVHRPFQKPILRGEVVSEIATTETR